ncbi:MAG: calcium binding hemolysin protein, partial [Sphingomonas bacterium]|nr:calcium binding hemolysin protein [Sphingomonas bacterium]
SNPQIIRSSDGMFFAGTVEKRNAQGQITDVILAFAGAEGAQDTAEGELLQAGIMLTNANDAIALYQQLLDTPAYAGATIHVTGHSLGAGLTQYIAAYAIAMQGAAGADARSDFTGFGSPSWEGAAALRFGLDMHAPDGHYQGYAAANDVVRLNGVTPGGVDIAIPAYDRIPLPGGAVYNLLAAHDPATYVGALGLPAWMSANDQALVYAEDIASGAIAGYSMSYFYPGGAPLTITGDAVADRLTGLGGADTIISGLGADVMTGGGAADRFAYRSLQDSGVAPGTIDQITDFSQSDGARIDLSAIDARPTILFRQAFTFVAGGHFTGPGQVTSWDDGTNTFVGVNVSGGSAPDMVIELLGVRTLTAGDFAL